VTPRALILIAAGGSAALLAGAFLFQALGWAPCAMCLWQRWPHGAAVALGAAGLFLPLAPVAYLGALAAATTSGLGIYHSGVERDWWEGPASCTSAGGGISGLSGSDLLSTDGPALVLCDQFTPFLFGLSMANWNALISAGLVLIWLLAARKSGT
jgi:disulfide bond formation protein DsbB